MKNAYSEKTDVWAYGITLIEILTRKAPYPNRGLSEITILVATQQLNPSEQIPEWVTTEFREFMTTKLFAFDSNKRATFKVNDQSTQNSISQIFSNNFFFLFSQISKTQEIMNFLNQVKKI